MEGQPHITNEHKQQHDPAHAGEKAAQPSTPEQQRFKTLGVRIEEGLHAQLSFIAQLSGSTLAEEIRESIEARVRAAQDDPELVARAEAVQAELEREAEAKRQAIAGFFGRTALTETVEEPTATPTRRSSTRKKALAEPDRVTGQA